ncbi:hypothetical protein LTR05_003068 [Lithohypha guttulata]|uniref:DUF7779 domain-containing protein n=1 Tax=Lithohypha guttulata TaxID=1690604 RepID=A0AAN7YIL2_9EURO|nr:hypothetical protein LTR05_003068 [Lithohypha guttulata]
MDFGDAEEHLLQAALIEKNATDQHLSVHRLVQAAVMRKAPDPQKTKYLDAAIQVLRHIFVDHREHADIVNFLKAWTSERWLLHERCLPHVIHLIRQCMKYNTRSSSEDELLQLLLPCEISAREREMYDMSDEINHFALAIAQDKTGLGYASVLFKDGLNKLYTNQSELAIEKFTEGIQIRERLLGSEHSLVSWGYNNLGLCFTELNRHAEALTNLNIALEQRKQNDPACIGNSYSNLASLHLKMAQPDEAEKYLFSCPSLQDFTDELLLSKNNPRFAGDMVLLSRIRRAQGRFEDALRLASKALQYRKRLLGNRFATCDSMHDVATLLMLQKETHNSASLMLQELISITQGFSSRNGKGQLARAYYRLAVLHEKMGNSRKSTDSQQQALSLAQTLLPDGVEATFEEDMFSRLCPWMLW